MGSKFDTLIEKGVYLRPSGKYYVKQRIITDEGKRTSTTYTYETLEEARDYVRRRGNERKPHRYITNIKGRFYVDAYYYGLKHRTFKTLAEAIAYRDSTVAKPTVDVTAQEKSNPLWGVWK